MNRKAAESLRVQLFCAVLISLMIGAAVFGLSFLLGSAILDRTVYGHSFADKMAGQQFSKLQSYVDQEGISKEELQRLNIWCSRGDKVYLAIYQDETLIYGSHAARGSSDPELEDPDKEHILTLEGGEEVRAFLYYYAGDAFYLWMTAISALLAFAAFSLCFVILIGRKLSYIACLKEELDILSGGNLDYPVTVSGRDEIGQLAAGIDQMRRSILHHQQLEEQMRSANSQLITAMSHDLRTPLTSLLAYLEIVQRKKYRDEAQMEGLIQKCVGQTLRIRQMADQLFSYFLAYATDWEGVEMESLDADGIFHQILGEHAYALESRGMRVEAELPITGARLHGNGELLQRALDNIYSNILKYADPLKPISTSYGLGEGDICLSVCNAISAGCAERESTGIGLMTCRRIILHHQGQFTAEEREDGFHVELSIPIER